MKTKESNVKPPLTLSWADFGTAERPVPAHSETQPWG